MVFNLSDYEEIKLDDDGYLQEKADFQIYDYNTSETTYFRKKQPKQEFPIKIECNNGEELRISIDGEICFYDRHSRFVCSIYNCNLEQFEEAIKIAKKVRDDK